MNRNSNFTGNKVSNYLRTIQQHIGQKNHPIGVLIRAFKQEFVKENCWLLFDKETRYLNSGSPAPPMKSLRASMSQANESDGQTNINCEAFMLEAKRLIQEVKVYITIIQEIFMDFYEL
jgi:hypothetical protein